MDKNYSIMADGLRAMVPVYTTWASPGTYKIVFKTGKFIQIDYGTTGETPVAKTSRNLAEPENMEQQ
jgi:hypothetical protein